MKKQFKIMMTLLLIIAMVFSFSGCSFSFHYSSGNDPEIRIDNSNETDSEIPDDSNGPEGTPDLPDMSDAFDPIAGQNFEYTVYDDGVLKSTALVEEGGIYTTKEDVAAYLILYGELPCNFITKKEAQSYGWSGGGLDGYCDGMCIGGDGFGNREGLLPSGNGIKYTECDIDTLHKDSRGAKRLVFSNKGMIYYTDDHYDSFTILYGEE